MKIIIRNLSDRPLYQQIKDQVRAAILRGELPEGELLPSIRALATDLRVSVLTTKKAYDELEAEGFVVTVAGKGTYVARENMELFRESKRYEVELKLHEVWRVACSLGIGKEELLAMMNLVMEEEGEGE
jgi:GntR family transcriptional regulator